MAEKCSDPELNPNPVMPDLPLAPGLLPEPETELAEKKRLQAVRDEMTKLIDKSCRRLTVLKEKMGTYRSATKRIPHSIESLLYNEMKKKGVEIQSYHGGSLTGKDIKKVMNHAAELFDTFAGILKDNRKEGCLFDDSDIDDLCSQFRAVFLLWDGVFSYARKIDPTEDDCAQYNQFVSAAVQGHTNLGCSVTPKVHLMLKHTEHQMRTLPRGLGNKGEDFVEHGHQVGNKVRDRLRLLANAKQRAMTRAKILYLKTNPEVVGQIAAVDTKSRKRKHSDSKISKVKRAKLVRETTRLETLSQFGKESVWTLSQLLLQVEQKTLDEAKNNGKP